VTACQTLNANRQLAAAFSQTARRADCPKGHFFAAQSAKKRRFFIRDFFAFCEEVPEINGPSAEG
jgi:hypothetical protein